MNNENELTAALATIEKCRELSGCPAGVDLQDHLRQLAAENVVLKRFPEQIVKFVGGLGTSEIGSDTKERIEQAANRVKTPATDRIVAAQRSAFVDEAVAMITESGALTFGDCLVALCQLREGAK